MCACLKHDHMNNPSLIMIFVVVALKCIWNWHRKCWKIMANQENKHKKGLGRGIDAFFGGEALFNQDEIDQEQVDVKDTVETSKQTAKEATVEAPATDKMVQEISVEDIRPNPYQPRHQFDEDALNR